MIIVISGKARAGKDTLAKILAKELQKHLGNTYILMAYAQELKSRVQSDFDMSYEQLWGEEKEVLDKRYVKQTDGDEVVFWTPREIMQEYGSFYRSINGNYWVDQLFNIIEEAEYKNVIITDGRYPNEITPVLERDGFHVRIVRDDKDTITNEAHSSETSLNDDSDVDIIIDNNGTISDLEETCKDIVMGMLMIMSKKENKNG
jgi:hypothetical protein